MQDEELETTLKQLQRDEPWLDRHWRHVSAVVYLTICLFDFVIMPSIVYSGQKETKYMIVEILKDSEDKKFVLDLLDRTTNKHWEPLTLINGGLFHLSFGAILTGAVLMRGQERQKTIQNGSHNGRQS